MKFGKNLITLLIVSVIISATIEMKLNKNDSAKSGLVDEKMNKSARTIEKTSEETKNQGNQVNTGNVALNTNTQQVVPSTNQVIAPQQTQTPVQQSTVPDQTNPSSKCPLGQVFNIAKNFCEQILVDSQK